MKPPKQKIAAKSTHLLILACISLLLFFTSCSEDTEASEIIPEKDSELYFEKSIDFSSENEEKTISFTTNKDWSIKISQSGGYIDWCTISPTEGKSGYNEISIRVERNEGLYERNATLILTAGDLVKKIIVTQKQKDAILLSSAKIEIDSNGGEIQVDVKSNVDFDVIIPEQFQSWIHKKEQNLGEYTFKIDKSDEYNKREGEIIFKSEQIEEVLKIYQFGEGVLILGTSEIYVSDKGDCVPIELKSNCEFGIKMPNVDWISLAQTKSISTHTLYYVISPNTTYQERETSIIYYDTNNILLSDTLRIIQSQKDAIILSEKEYEVASEGGYIEAKINSNIDYAIDIEPNATSWIKQIPQENKTKSLVEKKYVFQILENTLSKERIGYIYVTAAGKGISDTIQISQGVKQVADKKISVKVDKAGTLRGFLGKDFNDITHLKIEGPINGTDLRLLREMSGIDYYDNPTSGHLQELDLTQATIVSGGEKYCETWSSDNIANTIPIRCFSHSNLVSISLPSNLESVETQAFFWAQKLENVSIPNSCRTIGLQSFGVTSISEVNIPASVSDIYYSAFERCPLLKSINVDSQNNVYTSVDGLLCDKRMERLICCPTGKDNIQIPNSIKVIDLYAFEYCNLITSLFIPSNIEEITPRTFVYMERLSSFTVDQNNKYYTSVDGVLYTKNLSELISCPKLKETLTIPDGVQVINPYSCSYMPNLISVNMPNSVYRIGDRAFRDCKKLSNINLSENIEYLDEMALSNCLGLFSISLPRSIRSLGDNAISGCENLESIYCYAVTPPYTGSNVFYKIPSSCIIYVPKGCTSVYKNNKSWNKFTIKEID